MAERPVTTLFMLMSLDGKINSGASDALDVDKDWKNIPGIYEGLYQYYDIEKTTDPYSLNSGRTQAKIGTNQAAFREKSDISFIVIDRKPHLDAHGTEYFARLSKTFFLVTNNPDHPAFVLEKRYPNIRILFYPGEIDLKDMMNWLKKQGVDRITIQTGGELNGALLRSDLVDFVHLVVAPVLVGGRNTPTVVDGVSLMRPEELTMLRPLKLLECNVLRNSYIQVIYQVIRHDSARI